MGSQILIADDEYPVRSLVGQILTTYGHSVTAVCSGREVLDKVNDDIDAIVQDINMPDINGFETLERLKGNNIDVPVLFLTGAASMDNAIKAINLGAYDFITKPVLDFGHFHAKIMRAIEKRTVDRREKQYRQTLEQELRDKSGELACKNRLLMEHSTHLENATVEMMSSLQTALEEKDEYTAGHTKRVTEYAMMIAAEIKLSDEDQNVLRQASHFHDIGKLVIDLSCIQKPEKLNSEEWELIRRHPVVGANILEPLTFMEHERFIIRHHHERLDGRGYPDGIGGDEIDLLTRIITVSDSFDAMTSRRNYRRNMGTEEALAELRRCSTSQFDPDLVEIFAGLVLSPDPQYN